MPPPILPTKSVPVCIPRFDVTVNRCLWPDVGLLSFFCLLVLVIDYIPILMILSYIQGEMNAQGQTRT